MADGSPPSTDLRGPQHVPLLPLASTLTLQEFEICPKPAVSPIGSTAPRRNGTPKEGEFRLRGDAVRVALEFRGTYGSTATEANKSSMSSGV